MKMIKDFPLGTLGEDSVGFQYEQEELGTKKVGGGHS